MGTALYYFFFGSHAVPIAPLAEDLVAAVRAIFEASPSATAIPGGLWRHAAADTSLAPYAVVDERSSRRELQSSTIDVYSVILGFKVYAADNDEAGRLGEALAADLIGANPSFAGAMASPLIAQGESKTRREKGRAKDARDSWCQDRELRTRVIRAKAR